MKYSKYSRKIGPYFLLITCGLNVILFIYKGQLFTRLATIVLYVIVMLGATGAILEGDSKE